MALKDIREKKGWSQTTLAKRSTVSNQTISDIESGRNRRPAWDFVAKLAFALECDPHEIVPVELPQVSR